MSRRRPVSDPPVPRRGLGIGVCLLLGTVLWLAGLSAGLAPLWRTLSTTWQARHWQPVAATVVEHEVVRHRRAVSLHVLYRYEWAGRPYLGDRLGPESDGRVGGSEAVAAWSERLAQAQREARPLTAWVDPAAPHRALLQRRPALAELVFMLPFALAFPGAGLALWGLAWALWRAPANLPEGEWVAGAASAWRWTAALVWSALSVPVTGLFWLKAPGLLSGLMVLVFDGVALSLLWAAWSDGGRRRWGEALALLGLLACLGVGAVRLFEPVTPDRPPAGAVAPR